MAKRSIPSSCVVYGRGDFFITHSYASFKREDDGYEKFENYKDEFDTTFHGTETMAHVITPPVSMVSERSEFILFLPDLETVRIYARQYTHIPIYVQKPYDGRDIISIYAAFRAPFTFLLESGEQTYNSRYSIIALPCRRRLAADESHTYFYDGDHVTCTQEDPMKRMEESLKQKSPIYPDLAVFTGGAIGHFNYDTIRLFEKLPDTEKEDLHLPLMQFGFTDDLIVIDHKKNLVSFISNMQGESDDITNAYEEAKKRIQNMIQHYHQVTPYKREDITQTSPLTSNYTREEFTGMVKQAKAYIQNGDIFQVVLSQRMYTAYHQDPLQAYTNMREHGASPYMYYLDFNDYVIAGVSPELLLQARGNAIRTMPIAGTRPRGKNQDDDERLCEELKHDFKENAEHMMLVDLGRNDIGKVSRIGSVQVRNMKKIQRYSHVMHMTSEVHGILREDKTLLDALGSLIPAGTLSGAPKIRAMEIIDELEHTKREIYGGAIGFLGYNDQFDTCITIRTMIFHKGKVYLQAGAGIVKDSNPDKEYEETLHKAAVLLDAIGKKVAL